MERFSSRDDLYADVDRTIARLKARFDLATEVAAQQPTPDPGVRESPDQLWREHLLADEPESNQTSSPRRRNRSPPKRRNRRAMTGAPSLSSTTPPQPGTAFQLIRSTRR